jgi:hypothetical protein
MSDITNAAPAADTAPALADAPTMDDAPLSRAEAENMIQHLMGGSPEAKEFQRALLKSTGVDNQQARDRWNRLHRLAAGQTESTPGVRRDGGIVSGPERVVSSNAPTQADIPATPADYKINVQPIGRERSESEAAHAERVNARAALHDFAKAAAHAGGFTQSDLDAVTVAWDGQMQALGNGMTVAQIDAQYDSTLAEMAREHGGHDAAMARVKLANSTLNALPPDVRAKAVALLRLTGLGSNRILIERLAGIAERRAQGGAA